MDDGRGIRRLRSRSRLDSHNRPASGTLPGRSRDSDCPALGQPKSNSMGWSQVDIVTGETRANVIPLHTNRGRVAARRRADHRTEDSTQHPSLLADSRGRASAEQLAAVVREIDEHRRAAGAPSPTEAPLNELAERVAAVTGFLRKRLTGDYS